MTVTTIKQRRPPSAYDKQRSFRANDELMADFAEKLRAEKGTSTHQIAAAVRELIEDYTYNGYGPRLTKENHSAAVTKRDAKYTQILTEILRSENPTAITATTSMLTALRDLIAQSAGK